MRRLWLAAFAMVAAVFTAAQTGGDWQFAAIAFGSSLVAFGLP